MGIKDAIKRGYSIWLLQRGVVSAGQFSQLPPKMHQDIRGAILDGIERDVATLQGLESPESKFPAKVVSKEPDSKKVVFRITLEREHPIILNLIAEFAGHESRVPVWLDVEVDRATSTLQKASLWFKSGVVVEFLSMSSDGTELTQRLMQEWLENNQADLSCTKEELLNFLRMLMKPVE